MRVRDYIHQNSIPWPPPVIGPMGQGRRPLTPEDFRAAVLRSVQWTDREGAAAIDLWLVYAGSALNPTSIPCPKAKEASCRKLYEALEEGLGGTMGEIEDTEVRPDQ